VRKLSARVLLGIVAVASLVGGVFAFVSFTQHFPSVVVTGRPNLISDCSTLSADASTPQVIVYSCTGSPALTVTNGPVTATPTTTADSGSFVIFASFSLISPTDTCTSTAGIALTAGTAVSIPSGNYNYCATTNSGGTFGAFDVTWS
jgi:hypothetical protein